MLEPLRSARDRLEAWIVQQQFLGWDPHDALNSSVIRLLTCRSRLLAAGAVQVLRRSPVNLRPVLGVVPGYNAKAMGLFLGTYARRYRSSGSPQDRERALGFAQWLRDNASPGYHGPCWGYNFDWPNRSFYAPAGTPTIVNTVLVALAFLDAGQSHFSSDTLLSTERATECARGACQFVLQDLNRLQASDQELCFSYTPLDRRWIHNANLLGARLLARVSVVTGESVLAETALLAARYSARRQQLDGSWRYGEAAREGWVDNFHTGYVLVALQEIATILNSTEFDISIDKGYFFWKHRMFDGFHVPKYYPNQTYPIDAHSLAQAIFTFLAFQRRDPEALERARSIAGWAIENMQDRDGHFHYQLWRRYRIRTPYMRWSQAWMLLALTDLIAVLEAA